MQNTVLVVDDDPAIVEFVSDALRDEGYSVITATNGATALVAVRQYQPQVVVLDMRMPVMDGWAFLAVYCGQAAIHAPVIAISAHTQQSPTMQCIDAFLAKPFDLDVLLDLIAKCTPSTQH
jgi:CheY-like chemotaxis protein